jgi:hypothetical protein
MTIIFFELFQFVNFQIFKKNKFKKEMEAQMWEPFQSLFERKIRDALGKNIQNIPALDRFILKQDYRSTVLQEMDRIGLIQKSKGIKEITLKGNENDHEKSSIHFYLQGYDNDEEVVISKCMLLVPNIDFIRNHISHFYVFGKFDYRISADFLLQQIDNGLFVEYDNGQVAIPLIFPGFNFRDGPFIQTCFHFLIMTMIFSHDFFEEELLSSTLGLKMEYYGVESGFYTSVQSSFDFIQKALAPLISPLPFFNKQEDKKGNELFKVKNPLKTSESLFHSISDSRLQDFAWRFIRDKESNNTKPSFSIKSHILPLHQVSTIKISEEEKEKKWEFSFFREHHPLMALSFLFFDKDERLFKDQDILHSISFANITLSGRELAVGSSSWYVLPLSAQGNIFSTTPIPLNTEFFVPPDGYEKLYSMKFTLEISPLAKSFSVIHWYPGRSSGNHNYPDLFQTFPICGFHNWTFYNN